MTHMEQFIADVTAEREYQASRWDDTFDSRNTPNDWVAYLAKYLGQAVTYPWDGPTFRKNLVKIAAICGAAVEWYDRTNGNMAKRHYDN